MSAADEPRNSRNVSSCYHWPGGSACKGAPGPFSDPGNNPTMETTMPVRSKTRKTKSADDRQFSFLGLLDTVLTETAGLAMTVPEAPTDVTASHFDDDQLVRRQLNALIQASGVNRTVIAERMSRLSGHPVTKAMIDSWTGAGRPNAFPLHYQRAFLRACNARPQAELTYLEPLLEGTGWAPVDAMRARLVALGQWALALLEGLRRMNEIAATAQAGGRR
ncbi:hypothetical protein CCP1ISM_110010 [Azospirillaceae bacterium]